MPVFIAALIGGLISAAGSIVGRVLISLGIGYVTYRGIDTSLAWAKNAVVTSFQTVGTSNTLAVLSALRVGVCISILTSALAARMVLKGLSGGAIKSMVLK